MGQPKEIYKAVRNYICNELGINRGIIDAELDQKISDRVEHLLGNMNIEKAVCNMVLTAARQNKWPEAYSNWNLKTLENLIAESVRTQVDAIIKQKLKNLKVDISNE